MTRDLRDLDEAPAQPWRETSSAKRRREAIEATAAAVQAAKDARKKRAGDSR
jgi:hypothetical protein